MIWWLIRATFVSRLFKVAAILLLGVALAVTGCTALATQTLQFAAYQHGMNVGESGAPVATAVTSPSLPGNPVVPVPPAQNVGFDPTPPDIPLSGSTDGVVISADAGGMAAFRSSFAPYAALGGAELNIDPSIVTAMAISESGGGNIPGNSFFGMKAGASPLANGSISLQTWELINGARVVLVARFDTFATPQIAIQAWVDYVRAHDPAAVGARTVEQFAAGLKAGGYMSDTAAHYAQTLLSLGAHDAP